MKYISFKSRDTYNLPITLNTITLLKFSRWFEPVFGATAAAIIKWWNLVLMLGAIVQHNSICWNEIWLQLLQHKTWFKPAQNFVQFSKQYRIRGTMKQNNISNETSHKLYGVRMESLLIIRMREHLWKVYTSQHRHSEVCSCYNLWKLSDLASVK